ncbi:hypothetical protein DFH06DRAFT_1342473 [Mycena polygramma]|nr:hypothetical protein DFH06DRAFT_1342473 [Mycena polygramma]
MFSKLLFTAAAFCALGVVHGAPGYQTSLTACNAASAMAPPPTGQFTIGNVDSQGGLLFEGSDGKGLVDFRRKGNYHRSQIWEIRKATTTEGAVTIWNVGTGHPLTHEGSFAEDGFTPAEFEIIQGPRYPFYKIKQVDSDKLWTFNYAGEGRYPDYGHLTLRTPPSGDLPDSFAWELKKGCPDPE